MRRTGRGSASGDSALRVEGVEPRDLSADTGTRRITAETEVATRDTGPFEPLGVALQSNPTLRDAFVAQIPTPSSSAFARARMTMLGLAVVPLVISLELDRELLVAGRANFLRIAFDIAFTIFVGYELTRPTPRVRAAVAAVLLATSTRWLLAAAEVCGKGVAPPVWIAAGLGAASAIFVLARAPSPARVALELASKLGISRSDLYLAGQRAIPSIGVTMSALGAAAALPIMLHVMRDAGLDAPVQGVAFVAFALAVPPMIERLDAHFRREPRRPLCRALLGGAAGLILGAALVQGAHQFFVAGSELARCVGKLDAEGQRLLQREMLESTRSIAHARTGLAMMIFTAAIVPLAEERVYRGLLFDVLARKYGFAYGLFASSVVFGVAHMGLYEVDLYQTMLLGAGLAVAYAEGGIVAAYLAHALWNFLSIFL